MPIYTPGRRRTIIILLLSSVLLITIDLRGNALLNAARSGFDYAFRPFEIAAEVVSRPVVRAWDGITRVDDLERENAALQRRVDQMQSDSIAGQNALIQNRQLRALLDLESLASFDRVSCSTIGASPSNYDQTVEIDCGSLDGLKTGMPVINDAGLVGKVTQTYPETAVVMLLTDPSYHIAVKVVGERDPEPPADEAEAPSNTTPSGVPVGDLEAIADEFNTTTTSTTTTTLPPGVPLPTPTPAGTPVPTPGAGDGAGAEPGTATSSTTTTTTTIPSVTRETGSLDGYGPDRLPRVSLIANSPQFSTPRAGDAVLTTGGGADLAPPNLPIGVIVNVERRAGTEGLLLEVEPSADLARLDFLTVVLYQPPTEMPR